MLRVTDRLRWGVVGTGWIAEREVIDLQRDGAVVSAIGSRSVGAARTFADRFGIARAHGSYADLVADPAVDLVYVATPHPMHAEHALLAIEAGKPVLVEKPFTLTGAEARQVFDAARSARVPVLEAMWTRFLPQHVRVREIIREGVLGDVRRVLADSGQVMTTDPAHRINDLTLGGGALLDLGIYPLSFAWSVLGSPGTTLTSATLGPTGADRSVSLLLEYGGGRQAVLATSADDRGPNRAAIVGTMARVEFSPVFYTGSTSFVVTSTDGVELERWDDPPPGRGMQFQARELARMVRGGELESPVLPWDETVAILEHLDEIRARIGVRYPSEA
jgi:predicted dehydrogenase